MLTYTQHSNSLQGLFVRVSHEKRETMMMKH